MNAKENTPPCSPFQPLLVSRCTLGNSGGGRNVSSGMLGFISTVSLSNQLYSVNMFLVS